MWKVNAGRRSLLATDFISRNVVAIGWRETGNYTDVQSRADLLERINHAYPDRTDRQNEVSTSQVWRFLREVQIGDIVITYDPTTRLYHLGKIAGPPRFAPDEIEQLPVQRAVKWETTVPRDELSDAARGRLGAILTLFKVEQGTAEELQARASGAITPTRLGETPLENAGEDADPFLGIEEQAIERVKDKLLGLDWSEMQEIVASLLRALGYRTIISPAGPDRGKDIIASRDGFGFEPPRIVVEVKHRKEQMGAPEIRAFLGGRHAQDRGLYLSTGGFSREAHFEAERAATVTHLMTLDGLAQALIDNYEQIDERGRALIPLIKLYWPA
jgi:restriction system protein